VLTSGGDVLARFASLKGAEPEADD
jgi:hypothetical protein